MTDRRERLLRLYKVTDLMLRYHTQKVAELNTRLIDLEKAEAKNINYFNADIPSDLVMSRIHLLRKQRQSIVEIKLSETAKANLAGLKLKRIGRLLAKSVALP